MKLKKTTQKKRCGTLTAMACCALWLLAGCAQQTTPADTVSGAAPDASQSATETGTGETGHASPIKVFSSENLSGNGVNHLGVYIPVLQDGGAYIATRVNFSDGVQQVLCQQQGCAHNDEACGAFIVRIDQNTGVPQISLLPTQDKLVWIVEDRAGTGAQSFVEVSDVDGVGRRRLDAQIGKTQQTYLSRYYDDENLYYLDGDGKLMAISFADGKQKQICDTLQGSAQASPDNLPWIWGSTGEQFVLYTATQGEQLLHMSDDPAVWREKIEQEQRNISSDLFIVSRDGTLAQNVLAWTGNEYVSVAPFTDSTLYGIDTDTGALMAQDILTGEKSTLSTQLPKAISALFGPRVGEWLLVETSTPGESFETDLLQRFAVHSKTGETREITLKVFVNNREQPISIIGVSDDKLLVVMEQRAITKSDVGTGGDPFTFESSQAVHGLISVEDFLASNPNYTDCTMLPSFLG